MLISPDRDAAKRGDPKTVTYAAAADARVIGLHVLSQRIRMHGNATPARMWLLVSSKVWPPPLTWGPKIPVSTYCARHGRRQDSVALLDLLLILCCKGEALIKRLETGSPLGPSDYISPKTKQCRLWPPIPPSSSTITIAFVVAFIPVLFGHLRSCRRI